MVPWDEMADIFGCRWDAEEIPECAADNIVIAWPSLLAGIGNHFGRLSDLMVLCAAQFNSSEVSMTPERKGRFLNTLRW